MEGAVIEDGYQARNRGALLFNSYIPIHHAFSD
jgi:hypothetical protein